tara:strand:+ start:44 stop:781 length:738 start_codon:yes stop_codon:yes gene_type:complete
MKPLPLNLIVFCTTMGHAGRHTYKDCINNLYEKIDPSVFANRLLHLKSRDGEEDIAEEIKSLCSSLNIRVIETKENIVYHAENHQVHSAGYFKDIYKSYSDLEIRKQKYSFWVEDDELIQVNKIKLEDAFKKSIEFLDNNPDQICVRFNRGVKFKEPEGNILLENEDIFTQAINYTEYGPTFTFQPNISRTNEIFIAWKEAQNHLDKLGKVHCEIVSGHLLKKLTNSQTPFSFFDSKKVYSKTIG